MIFELDESWPKFWKSDIHFSSASYLLARRSCFPGAQPALLVWQAAVELNEFPIFDVGGDERLERWGDIGKPDVPSKILLPGMTDEELSILAGGVRSVSEAGNGGNGNSRQGGVLRKNIDRQLEGIGEHPSDKATSISMTDTVAESSLRDRDAYVIPSPMGLAKMLASGKMGNHKPMSDLKKADTEYSRKKLKPSAPAPQPPSELEVSRLKIPPSFLCISLFSNGPSGHCKAVLWIQIIFGQCCAVEVFGNRP
jgi:hypothetical protein